MSLLADWLSLLQVISGPWSFVWLHAAIFALLPPTMRTAIGTIGLHDDGCPTGGSCLLPAGAAGLYTIRPTIGESLLVCNLQPETSRARLESSP